MRASFRPQLSVEVGDREAVEVAEGVHLKWTIAFASVRPAKALTTPTRGLIDAELTAPMGAELHERTDTRTNQRSGGRSRTLSTPAGDIELRITKMLVGSFFPSLLEPRPRVVELCGRSSMTAHITGFHEVWAAIPGS